MSALPYMKFYPGDYLGDTQHLSMSQHGAYLLLIMAYWNNGGPLPADDAKLARITRSSNDGSHDDWISIKSEVLAFFEVNNGMIHHPRIDRDIAAAMEISEKRKAATAQRERKRQKSTSHDASNDDHVIIKRSSHDPIYHSHSHEEEEKELDPKTDLVSAVADDEPFDIDTEDQEGEEVPGGEKRRIPYYGIIAHLNTECHTNFKHSTPETRRLIKARFNAGFTIDDFFAVIGWKARQWLTDDKMCGYLRPQTLFGTKFEAYLNEIPKEIRYETPRGNVRSHEAPEVGDDADDYRDVAGGIRSRFEGSA